ncbi:MAG TPA: GAF domain-containing sensor histidine kinase [Solirubrobacteraceae bacterium]|nr:GAF domain-containing sensor histidine kinase [Solirubrobacteraceae bacterium]
MRSGRRDLLRTVAEGTAGAVGDEFLAGLVRHIALAFDAKFAFVAEAADPTGQHVRVVSGWYEDDWLAEPFEYDTEGKPCALVVEQSVVEFPQALTERFPEARPAIEMGLESYLAVCLRAADGTHLGHVGVMDAGPMEAEDDDVAAMRIFASRAAAELERRQQAAALRRSRTRVIEAADAERRRVGRDLHDGAQQRLAAVANLLRAAELQLERGADAGDTIRFAHGELDSAQTELRELARGLHPVALSERGLRSAIESLIVGSEPRVTLDVNVEPLPDAVELAAYFIVSESLVNARRYADCDTIEVRVAPVEDGVLVEIADDGCGGADPAGGTGLRGLADRIEALGGRLEVDSPVGGGTRVRAWLPRRLTDL